MGWVCVGEIKLIDAIIILKMLPYLLIIFALVVFFVTPDNLGPTPQNANVIQVLALDIVSLPWWGKLL